MGDQDNMEEPFVETQDADPDVVGDLLDSLYADDKPEPTSEAAPVEDDQDALEDESDDEASDEEENTDEPEAEIATDDLQTLKRAGYSEARIAKMGPELAAELAEDAREAKRANDREYQEYLAQKRKAETDESERQEAGDKPQPSQPTLKDLASLTQPFADDLGVEPESLANFAQVIMDATSEPLRQQVTDLLANNDRQAAILEEALVDSALSRLSGDFPQLRGSEKLDSILEKTRNVLLANPQSKGSYIDRIASAMRDVASVEFKDEIVKRELDRKDKQRQRGRQRAKGQPTPNARRGGSGETPDAMFRAQAAQLLDEAGI